MQKHWLPSDKQSRLWRAGLICGIVPFASVSWRRVQCSPPQQSPSRTFQRGHVRHGNNRLYFSKNIWIGKKTLARSHFNSGILLIHLANLPSNAFLNRLWSLTKCNQIPLIKRREKHWWQVDAPVGSECHQRRRGCHVAWSQWPWQRFVLKKKPTKNNPITLELKELLKAFSFRKTYFRFSSKTSIDHHA